MVMEESGLASNEGYNAIYALNPLRREIQQMIAELGKMDRELHNRDVRTLARGLQLTLTVLATSMGECQEEIPYSAMRPIHKNGRTVWCCNHNPEHCG